MTVRVSFHPDVVARLAAQGITAQRTTEDAPPSASRSTSGGGFVLAHGPGPRAQGAVSHVVSVCGHVVVTGRQLPQAARQRALPAAPVVVALNAERDGARTSSELIAECDRLRRENQRLSGEAAKCDRLRRENQRLAGDVTRLRAEVARLSSRFEEPRGREPVDLDDAATRFSLLELDL